MYPSSIEIEWEKGRTLGAARGALIEASSAIAGRAAADDDEEEETLAAEEMMVIASFSFFSVCRWERARLVET